MKQEVLVRIVYGIMWASSLTLAQTKLSELNDDDYPTYIVIESKTESGKETANNFSEIIHPMDEIGYEVDETYQKDDFQLGFIFKKKRVS